MRPALRRPHQWVSPVAARRLLPIGLPDPPLQTGIALADSAEDVIELASILPGSSDPQPAAEPIEVRHSLVPQVRITREPDQALTRPAAFDGR